MHRVRVHCWRKCKKMGRRCRGVQKRQPPLVLCWFIQTISVLLASREISPEHFYLRAWEEFQSVWSLQLWSFLCLTFLTMWLLPALAGTASSLKLPHRLQNCLETDMFNLALLVGELSQRLWFTELPTSDRDRFMFFCVRATVCRGASPLAPSSVKLDSVEVGTS